MGLKIDLRVPPCAPPQEVAAFVRRAEEAGFSGVGMPDMQMLERDAFVCMALALQATSHIRVAVAVTNLVTRHITVLACAAQTLAELAPGRVEFWIGRGDNAVYSVGLRHATLRQMRDSILTLKSLLAGERVAWNGTTTRMRHGGTVPVPICIAADGPKAIGLAGEVADGALLRVGVHPKAVAAARALLEEGAKRGGREANEVHLILDAHAIIREDMRTAREMARPHCVRWLLAGGAMVRWLKEAGIDTDSIHVPPELVGVRPEATAVLGLYPDLHHAEDWDKARQLTAFLSEEDLNTICEATGFTGTADYCAQRLKEIYADGGGPDHFFLSSGNAYAFPERELRAFRDTIFPAISALR